MLTNKNRIAIKKLVEEFGLASQEFGVQEEKGSHGAHEPEELRIALERMEKSYKDLINLLAES